MHRRLYVLDRRERILSGRATELWTPLRVLEGQLKALDGTRSSGATFDFFFLPFGRVVLPEDNGLLIFCINPFSRAISFRVFL